MKKKITVVDKTFTPIVVLADANSAIYEDRGQRLGEQNLLSETVITCTAMDGTKKVATMKASILQVPTKFMPAATTSAPGIPAKQLAINYLCDKSAEVDERYDREKNDNIAMILPVTTHLYIDSLEVEEPYRNRGIATAMLDFIISMRFLKASVSSLRRKMPKCSVCSRSSNSWKLRWRPWMCLGKSAVSIAST